MIHKITLSGYSATTDDISGVLILGTYDSYGIERIQLELGPEWNALVIKATFNPPTGSEPVTVVADTSGQLRVPQEATSSAGQGAITFVGTAAGLQRISTDLPYIVKTHSQIEGATPSPTPSEWEQFVAQVQQARDDAEAAAQAAEDSQTAAAGSASDAANSAEAAAQSAQEAQNIADGAVQDITDAKNAAVQAVQAAQTTAVGAVNDAGNAKIEQIEQINALVPTPTPEDAGKVVVVKPDGTGYELGDAGSEIDDAVVAPDTTWSSLGIINKLCPPFSVTGDTVQFNPVEGYPLSVQSTIVATQSGEGDPSPENVRPIVPVSEVSAWVGGKNLLNLEGREVVTKGAFENTSRRELNGNKLFVGLSANNYFSNSKILNYTVNKDSVSIESVADRYGIGFDVRVKPGMQLTASPSSTGKLIQFAFYDEYGNYISSSFVETGTVPDNAVWAVAVFRPTANTVVTYQNPQVEIGSAATAYEPYRGQLYTAQLDEPCYGGTVDLTGGTGEATWDAFTLNSKTCAGWFYGAMGNQTVPVLRGAVPGAKTSVGASYCTHFAPASSVPMADLTYWSKDSYFGNAFIAIRNDVWDSLESALEWFDAKEAAGTPVQLLYQLSTPTPFTVTPLTIHAPASPATAYSTSGEITVSGRSDPTVLIQQMQSRLAALESAQTGI